jgi:hypothetical protein
LINFQSNQNQIISKSIATRNAFFVSLPPHLPPSWRMNPKQMWAKMLNLAD